MILSALSLKYYPVAVFYFFIFFSIIIIILIHRLRGNCAFISSYSDGEFRKYYYQISWQISNSLATIHKKQRQVRP